MSVDKFLDGIEDEERRADCKAIAEMMREATGEEPKMWGSGIVGFGNYHYKYESGREGDTMVVGFAPRKSDITLYLSPGLAEEHSALLEKLGKCKLGKGCLYVKRLRDVDAKALHRLIGAVAKSRM
jgi:Domain of unknown function (DU1801)